MKTLALAFLSTSLWLTVAAFAEAPSTNAAPQADAARTCPQCGKNCTGNCGQCGHVRGQGQAARRGGPGQCRMMSARGSGGGMGRGNGSGACWRMQGQAPTKQP
jgi:hypothetical protein